MNKVGEGLKGNENILAEKTFSLEDIFVLRGKDNFDSDVKEKPKNFERALDQSSGRQKKLGNSNLLERNKKTFDKPENFTDKKDDKQLSFSFDKSKFEIDETKVNEEVSTTEGVNAPKEEGQVQGNKEAAKGEQKETLLSGESTKNNLVDASLLWGKNTPETDNGIVNKTDLMDAVKSEDSLVSIEEVLKTETSVKTSDESNDELSLALSSSSTTGDHSGSLLEQVALKPLENANQLVKQAPINSIHNAPVLKPGLLAGEGNLEQSQKTQATNLESKLLAPKEAEYDEIKTDFAPKLSFGVLSKQDKVVKPLDLQATLEEFASGSGKDLQTQSMLPKLSDTANGKSFKTGTEIATTLSQLRMQRQSVDEVKNLRQNHLKAESDALSNLSSGIRRIQPLAGRESLEHGLNHKNNTTLNTHLTTSNIQAYEVNTATRVSAYLLKPEGLNYVDTANEVVSAIAQHLDDLKRNRENALKIKVNLVDGSELSCHLKLNNNILRIQFENVDDSLKSVLVERWSSLTSDAAKKQLRLDSPNFIETRSSLSMSVSNA